MKKLFEPLTGFMLSLISWEAWTNFFVSLIIAFLGGALAYLGKWICSRIVHAFENRRNVYKSKTREAINRAKSYDDDDDTFI